MATDTTALDLFSSQEVEHFERITKDVGELRVQLEALTVRDQTGATRVHNGLAEVKRFLLHIEKIRKDQVAPLNDQVRAINGAWRPVTEALTALEGVAKRKLLAFTQAERERVAREQEAARKKQEEAAKAEADALAKAAAAKNSKARDAALAKANVASQALMDARVAEPMDAPSGIRTDAGTTSTRFRWTFKVVEPADVPRDFLVVDEKAIRRAVAEGAREIAGVLIFEEEQLATRVSG